MPHLCIASEIQSRSLRQGHWNWLKTFGRMEMAKAPERMQRRHLREKATIDHLVKDVYKPKPIFNKHREHSPNTPAACRSRIRSARNGIPDAASRWPESARGRRRCTRQQRSPDRSDTGRLASPAGTTQDAPKQPLVLLSGNQTPGPPATTVKLRRASAGAVLCATLNAATGRRRPFSSRFPRSSNLRSRRQKLLYPRKRRYTGQPLRATGRPRRPATLVIDP